MTSVCVATRANSNKQQADFLNFLGTKSGRSDFPFVSLGYTSNIDEFHISVVDIAKANLSKILIYLLHYFYTRIGWL